MTYPYFAGRTEKADEAKNDTTDEMSLPLVLVHEDVGVVRYTTAEPGYSPSTDGSAAIRVYVLDEGSLSLLCKPAISRFRTRHVLPITHPYHCGVTERRPEAGYNTLNCKQLVCAPRLQPRFYLGVVRYTTAEPK